MKNNLIKNLMRSILFSFVATLPSFCAESPSVHVGLAKERKLASIVSPNPFLKRTIQIVQTSDGGISYVLLNDNDNEILREPMGHNLSDRQFFSPLFSVDGKVVAIILDNDDSSKWNLKYFSTENGSLIGEFRLVCCDKKPVFTLDRHNIFVYDEEAKDVTVYRFCDERGFLVAKEPIEKVYFESLLSFKILSFSRTLEMICDGGKRSVYFDLRTGLQNGFHTSF